MARPIRPVNPTLRVQTSGFPPALWDHRLRGSCERWSALLCQRLQVITLYWENPWQITGKGYIFLSSLVIKPPIFQWVNDCPNKD